MQTAEYAPDRFADVFGAPSAPPALLWHGMQTDARSAVRVLAEELAKGGLGVVAPDWNSHAGDGGRADLLASLDWVRSWSQQPDRLTLIGWSLGAAAAAGLTLHADRFEVRLARTVCLGGAFMARDPISGEPSAQANSSTSTRAPFTLIHGLHDEVVPPTASRDFAARLEAIGWPVEVVELPTDHAAIAGAGYDPAADRYLPAADPETRRIAAEVAGRIAAARQI